MGSLLCGSGMWPNASRMAAKTLFISLFALAASPGLVGFGLSTQRITKNPIMSMTRSANVKIHSGHSSHSSFLHLQAAFFAILVHHGAHGEHGDQSYDSANDPIDEHFDVEVNEQPNSNSAQLQIRD